ncbi:hypothetical protein C5H24_12000 [Xylella fastidiosa]|nr:hypothetical protein C5H24_12000 [Xylella fastidiosa]
MYLFFFPFGMKDKIFIIINFLILLLFLSYNLIESDLRGILSQNEIFGRYKKRQYSFQFRIRLVFLLFMQNTFPLLQ